MSKVTLQRLWKAYGDKPAIRGADLNIDDGEFVTLLGESGCGKTTTLRCIAGLETPSGGRIVIGDAPVYDADTKLDVPTERRNLGMVFQSYALWPHLTVAENVGYPLRRRRMPRAAARDRVIEVLGGVGLTAFADRPVTALSGGQQQRVALARAIAAKPQLMLYDEPLSNLDPSLRRSMRDEILRLHRLGGTTSIYVTHDIEEAMHLSDRVIVMQDGLFHQAAPPAEIFASPATEFVARFVGFENILPAEVVASSGGVVEVRPRGLAVTVPIPRADGPAVGTSVSLAIRGANLRFAGDSEAIAVDGVVTEAVFLGARTEYLVACGDTVLRVVSPEADVRSGRADVRPGDAVRVAIDPALCAIVTTSTVDAEPVAS